MIETISGGINILMAMWVIILLKRNAKLTTEASNARLDAKMVSAMADELEKLRVNGL